MELSQQPTDCYVCWVMTVGALLFKLCSCMFCCPPQGPDAPGGSLGYTYPELDQWKELSRPEMLTKVNQRAQEGLLWP
jgi:hypothetical protein